MKITRSYKVELDPNKEQRTAMARHCGAARFVYNWGLNQKIEARNTGAKLPSAFNLDGTLRSIMAEEFPWLKEVSSRCRQGALANLDKAYKNFFDRCKKGKKGKATGFPKFKNRKKGLGGFVAYKYTVEQTHVRISRIGRVRLKEHDYLPLGGYGKNSGKVTFFGARITERAGRWYIAIHVEIEAPDSKQKMACVGVDVGIKTLATCSDRMVFRNSKALGSNLNKVQRLNRALSRKYEVAKKAGRPLRNCKNYQKNKRKLARLHAKIGDLRTHNLHHASHVITRKNNLIGIESLNVQGMMRNHHLAKAVADASFGELLRQIQYKATWRDRQVVVADRWFASSKTCHACGFINAGLTLAQRKWVCRCGIAHERDMNAAHNLKLVAINQMETINASGERSPEPTPVGSVPLVEGGSGQDASVSVIPSSAENSSIPSRVGKYGQLALW